MLTCFLSVSLTVVFYLPECFLQRLFHPNRLTIPLDGICSLKVQFQYAHTKRCYLVLHRVACQSSFRVLTSWLMPSPSNVDASGSKITQNAQMFLDVFKSYGLQCSQQNRQHYTAVTHSIE